MELRHKVLQISVEDVWIALSFSVASDYDNYIDAETGDVVFFPNATTYESWGSDNITENDCPDKTRFIVLPSLTIEQEYSLRRGFIKTLQNVDDQMALLDIMDKPGPFSAFNSYVDQRFNVQNEWIEFEKLFIKNFIKNIMPENTTIEFVE